MTNIMENIKSGSLFDLRNFYVIAPERLQQKLHIIRKYLKIFLRKLFFVSPFIAKPKQQVNRHF